MFSLYAFNCLNCGVLAMSCCPVPQHSSRTPSPVSAVTHCRASLALTQRHTGGVAVRNSSEVGNCFLATGTVFNPVWMTIHPVQVSFSKKHWNPSKSALSRYRSEISHSLEIQGRKHTRHFLHTCLSYAGVWHGCLTRTQPWPRMTTACVHSIHMRHMLCVDVVNVYVCTAWGRRDTLLPHLIKGVFSV